MLAFKLCPALRFYVKCVSYKNSEVARGAGDISSWGQGLGDVLHAEGCGQDPQGQSDHQIALRTFKCPAVTWVHIRLKRGGEGTNVKISFMTVAKTKCSYKPVSHQPLNYSNILDLTCFHYQQNRNVSWIFHGETHLDDNAWRLGEVPERQAKQTHEGRLGLIGLRAAGTEDAATCTHTQENRKQ